MMTTDEQIRASDHAATAGVKKATVSAVVFRKDGTVEDLGVISEVEDPATPPGFVAQIKDAWRAGWHEGKKDGT